MSDGGGWAVQFVLGMQDEQNLKGSDKFWMRLEWFLVEFVKHVQEVFHISQLLRGQVEISADSVTIWVGSDCWDVSKNFVDLFVSDLLVFVYCLTDQAWVLLWMQSWQSCDCAAKDSHRMSIVGEGRHHRVHVRVNKVVLFDSFGEIRKFLSSWQFAKENEKCNLEEGTLLGQYFDWIPPVL